MYEMHQTAVTAEFFAKTGHKFGGRSTGGDHKPKAAIDFENRNRLFARDDT